MNTPKAKSLIVGEQPLNETPDQFGNPEGGPPPQRGPGGPGRRPGGPPRRGPGPGAAHSQGFDLNALKDLIILDLLQAIGGDKFYSEIAEVALKGAPLTPQMAQHFMDEAPRYAGKMSPEVNELMGKIAALTQNPPPQ